MKTKVFLKPAEFSKIADEAFRKMFDDGEKFPIPQGYRGLNNHFYAAQIVVSPVERRSTFGDKHSKFVNALNYRHRRHMAYLAASDMGTAPVPTPVPAPLPTPTPVPHQHSGSCHHAPTAAPSPVPTPAPMEPLVTPGLSPQLAAAVIEVADLVRDYLSKDKDAMKMFTNRLFGFNLLKS